MTQSSDRLRILTYELPDGIVIKAPTKQFHAGVVSQSVSRRKRTCGIHDTSSPSFMKRGVDIGKDLYTNVVHITC